MRADSSFPTLFTLFTLVFLSVSAKSTANQSPAPQSSLVKRTNVVSGTIAFTQSLVCRLTGLFCDYTQDPANCGSAGHVCAGTYANSNGYVCVSSACGAVCNTLYAFNWATNVCQSVASDLNNCGSLGNVCSISGASTTVCSSGNCVATVCASGYSLIGGVCNKIINTTIDPLNCGKLGNVCSSTWANGAGATCLNSVCRATTCNSLYAWDPVALLCRSVGSDLSNCGAIGNVCSFPNGAGVCSSGVCTLSSCKTASGYYNVAGVCTYLSLTTDVNNCGTPGNICSFSNGLGSCAAGLCAYSSCNSGWSLGSNTCTAINLATDAKNCGTLGNKCPATYSFGGAGYCSLGVCTSTCITGYAFSVTANACIPILADINNCGKVGNICTTANGTPQCVSGVCSISSCILGYYAVSGVCLSLNLATDVNNCGAVGKVCLANFANGIGTSCVNSLCQATSCNLLYAWSPILSACISVSSDLKNCGGCGSVCAPTNGIGVCTLGICSIKSCNSGFQNVGGVCTQMDITSDLLNCGAVGNVCSFPLGAGTCSASVCTYTSCASPYVLTTLLGINSCVWTNLALDPNNCGAIGVKCPVNFLNGGLGICLLGVCQTACSLGFAFDFLFGFCRPVTSDPNNCGSCGNVCSITGASATACSSSKCIATACSKGYNLVSNTCVAVDTTSDPNNCGTVGNCCSFSPSGATGTCTNSKCVITACPTKYTLTSGVCLLNGASQRARAKRNNPITPTKQTDLCPTGETACPISGSASFDLAVSQHISMVQSYTGTVGSAAGFECLDTLRSLDSCGGCASTGQGQDCTAIRGAVGVGCDQGSCIVFSCIAGFRPSTKGNKCVRTHTEARGPHNTTRAAARRHLHAGRHATHHQS